MPHSIPWNSYLCDGQGSVMRAILYADRSCCLCLGSVERHSFIEKHSITERHSIIESLASWKVIALQKGIAL